jgi:hypothetical protein
MGLFRKRRKQANKNRVASRIETATLKKQHQLADCLNRKTQHWDKASKIIMLLAICLVFGGASLWLLIRALH